MLNSGEVPNIFPNDERVAICEVSPGGIAAQPAPLFVVIVLLLVAFDYLPAGVVLRSTVAQILDGALFLFLRFTFLLRMSLLLS